MAKFLKRLFGRETPPDVSIDDLDDGVIRLKLRRYGTGTDYVGALPCWFFVMISVKTGQHVGTCDLRQGWREEIAYAGHIGYRVFTPFRGNGYAERASRLLLKLAYRLKMEEILITCNPDNLPSRRILEKLDGDFSGIVQVPKGTPAWLSGDREKCQFFYQSKNYN